MVELLLQYERTTYRTRLQAVKHVTMLRTSGRLSRTWTEGGYYAKMSHVLPPPPRMPRMFTPEECDEMFDRAAARYHCLVLIHHMLSEDAMPIQEYRNRW